MGVKPLIGRVFTEEEGLKGVRVAEISHRPWQRRYGGSPDILGPQDTVNDNPYEVIGVMPPAFYFMPARDIDVWMPASFPAWMIRNFTWQNSRSWEGFPRRLACSLRPVHRQIAPDVWRGGFDAVQGYGRHNHATLHDGPAEAIITRGARAYGSKPFRRRRISSVRPEK
jgi:hypothetical protein